MKRAFFGIGLVALCAAISACSSQASIESGASQLDNLRTTIDGGAECSGVFADFDRISEDSSEFSTAQGELADIGCYTRDSERTDAKHKAQAPDSPWLGVPGVEVTPSGQCARAATAAASENDSTRAEPLIAATLEKCASVDEWMSALEIYPGVMGMAKGYKPQLIDLDSVCYSYIDSVVCQDALGRGLPVGP